MKKYQVIDVMEARRRQWLFSFFREKENYFNIHVEEFYQFLLRKGITTRGALFDAGVLIVEEYKQSLRGRMLDHVKKHLESIVKRNIEQLTMA